MKINKLLLNDFRCFSEFELQLRDGINLLVGDNASGKTSLLKACKYVASCIFSGFSDDNTTWISPNITDFRQESHGEMLSQTKPIRIKFELNCSILTRQPQELVQKSQKGSRPQITGIRELKQSAQRLMEDYFSKDGQVKALPLIASFTTEDIHARRKVGMTKFKKILQKPSMGYSECLEGNGFLPYWEKRLLVLKESKSNPLEIAIVINALMQALGPMGCDIFKDIEILHNDGSIGYVFKDGRRVSSDMLSDGYRRLVNIVMNLAFRCALLNRGIYGDKTCQLTHGIVIIDEIDLHLHPSLQAKVVGCLANTFPGLQIIASTHAPMVMSGVEDNDHNQVLKLEFSDQVYHSQSINPYGLDLSLD